MSEAEMHQLLIELEGKKSSERRKFGREDFSMIVDYSVNNPYYRDVIQNISENGVFIKTTKTFEKDQEIIMTFMSPDYQKPLKINGVIVRSHMDGFGAIFKTESHGRRTALKSLIHMIQND